MCRVMEEVLQEGIDLGIEKTMRKVVQRMLLDKVPLDQIVQYTGMPLSEIMALREKTKSL